MIPKLIESILIPIVSIVIVNGIFFMPLLYAIQKLKPHVQSKLLVRANRTRAKSFYYGCILFGSILVFLGGADFWKSGMVDNLQAECGLLSGTLLVALGYMSFYCNVIKVLIAKSVNKEELVEKTNMN